MTKRCYIAWDCATQTYRLTSPYSNTLVEGLKYLIPSGSRHWDKDSKVWYVAEPYGEVLRKISESCFGVGSVSFLSRKDAETQQQRYQTQSIVSQDIAASAIIEFFHLISYDDAKSLYRKTITRLHPDNGGDLEKSSRLNAAWDKIEKEFFKR
jgi:hypothetical protein